MAPSLSQSNYAILSEMISTNTAGKGSQIDGQTSDHILGLTWVLLDESIEISSKINQNTFIQLK